MTTPSSGMASGMRVGSMPRAIIYLRVSTDEQAESGLGLEAQLAACRAAAGRNGWEIASTFEDAMSGGLPLAKRTVLLDALTALSKGDILLVAKRDRLSRGDMMTTAMIEAAVKRAGARIVSAAGEGTESDDPASVLMRRDRRRLRRVRAAADQGPHPRGAQGQEGPRRATTARSPTAIASPRDGVRLEADRDEAAAVALIVELRAARMPLRAIAAELDRRNGPDQVRTALEAFHRPRRPQEDRRRWPGVRRPPASPSELRAADRLRPTSPLTSWPRPPASTAPSSRGSCAGKRTITLETADRLAEVLKLRIIAGR